jgi:ferredoxin-thioredoxin reductase catalytic subunit
VENSRDRIAAGIVKFQEKNGLHIHPGQEPLSWADLVIKKGGCPCVPGRKHCPCPQALDDIKELGRCRCGLFCNDDYLVEYSGLQAGKDGKKKWTGKQKANSSRKSPPRDSQ